VFCAPDPSTEILPSDLIYVLMASASTESPGEKTYAKDLEKQRLNSSKPTTPKVERKSPKSGSKSRERKDDKEIGLKGKKETDPNSDKGTQVGITDAPVESSSVSEEEDEVVKPKVETKPKDSDINAIKKEIRKAQGKESNLGGEKLNEKKLKEKKSKDPMDDLDLPMVEVTEH
jgi:hypothetical protein